MDEDAIFASYYADSGMTKELIIETWREIATSLNIPTDKLRPDDRFGIDIGRWLITSDNLDVLCETGRRRAEKLGLTIDFARIATVDDYARAFGSTSPS